MDSRKLVIGVVSSLSLSTTVYADELPGAATNWSGFYVGAHGGVGILDSDLTNTGRFQDNGTVNIDSTGGTVGAHLGWRMQQDNFVFGVEGDYGYLGLDNRAVFAAKGGSAIIETEHDWLATVRATAGVVNDGNLLYLTGGLAFSELYLSKTNPSSVSVTRTENVRGYSVGGGWAFQLQDGWSGRVEYLYTDFGSENLSFIGTTSTASAESSIQEIRFGISKSIP